MAIIDNEILKGCRGKLGDFIVYQYRGKTCLRARPEKANMTLSSGMVCQQERIAGVAAFYRAAKAVGMHHIWNRAAMGTRLTGYNLFVKRNLPAFAGMGHVGDFGKVHLSTGPLPFPDRMNIAQGAEDEWILT